MKFPDFIWPGYRQRGADDMPHPCAASPSITADRFMTLAALGSSTSRLNSAYAGSSSATAAPGSATQSASGKDSGVSSQSSGGIPFPLAVQQTLSDLGLSAGTTSTGAVLSGRRDRTGETATSAAGGSQAPAQDVHRLMHDLLSAIHYEQGTAAAYSSDKTASSNQDNYVSSFNAGLQSVIQQVEDNPDAMTGGTSNSALLAVRTDFRKLVNDLRAQTGNSTTQYPTLQEFLRSLSSTLQSQMASSASVGGLINTSA